MRPLTESLLSELYDDCLDELSDGCHLCQSYGHARILKEIDPIAYRCGMNDYQDSLDTFDCDGCGETFLLECDAAETTDDGAELCDDCAEGISTCEECGQTWHESKTPTPAARCPFESEHEEDTNNDDS